MGANAPGASDLPAMVNSMLPGPAAIPVGLSGTLETNVADSMPLIALTLRRTRPESAGN